MAAIFGAGFVWLLLRAQAKARLEQIKAALQGEIGVLNERLVAREAAVQEAQARSNNLETELREIRTAMGRIETERASLLTQLQEERKAAAEKLALIEEAKTRLADAF